MRYKDIKYVPTRNVITEAKRMADNFVKTNTDEFGDVSDIQVYYEAMNILAPFSDDLTVANKIADFRNKALSLETKIRAAENNQALFEHRLQESILLTIKNNVSDPRALLFKLAEVSVAAHDEFETDILGEALERLPKGQRIPQDLLDYKDILKKRETSLANLANSYLTVDEESNLAGPSNPDAYGFLIRTNPQTGAIVNLDIQEITSLEKAPSGYIKSNARYGRIPIYLNTYFEDNVEMAKLGNIKFKGRKETYEVAGDTVERKTLEGQWGEESGGVGFESWLTRTIGAMGEETRKGLKEQQQEFPLSAIPFDYFQVPTESVVKGGRGDYYYYDKDANLWKASDSEMLKRYLREIGKNPQDVDNNFYLGISDFISQRFQPDEEGNQRLIDEKMFGGTIEGALSTGGGVSVGARVSPPSLPIGSRIGVSPSFPSASRTTPASLPPSREYVPAKGYLTPKILDKAGIIFRGEFQKGDYLRT